MTVSIFHFRRTKQLYPVSKTVSGVVLNITLSLIWSHHHDGWV